MRGDGTNEGLIAQDGGLVQWLLVRTSRDAGLHPVASRRLVGVPSARFAVIERRDDEEGNWSAPLARRRAESRAQHTMASV